MLTQHYLRLIGIYVVEALYISIQLTCVLILSTIGAFALKHSAIALGLLFLASGLLLTCNWSGLTPIQAELNTTKRHISQIKRRRAARKCVQCVH